ncbi:MAG TPA: sigma-54 dependent transcriptional regulator [Bryobacteraceae bacterium]|nr:sigma-54 dependent transcriptional regulator [Bryobacteraceae bacterium]
MPSDREPIFLSKPMEMVLQFARRIAPTKIPVLITGETGTGKEVVAEHVHNSSGRRGSFIPIDCTAFPTELMESELFGHVRGAFTGALIDRRGLLESANGGTAFFDEIGDLPLHLQAKLLRALDRQEVRSIGSSAYRKVDFRIIAATNRDLKADVGQGRFREDLYYRLAGARIHLPPLRERPEDIAPLATNFAGRSLPKEMVELLTAYDWPGNVRQLRNCAKCLAQVGLCPLQGHPEEFFGCEIVAAIRHRELKMPSPTSAIRLPANAPGTMKAAEHSALIEALTFTHGRREETAQRLGIGRTTLYRRMKEHGIVVNNAAI